ncbi:sensor histidine kinase [Peribacillus asahii]|uniref:sensor histidine kinase n=1 Tax=Peribacillus asahii TaxID=228899 RepID=UPI0020799B7E|nr:sensor histidine kinase [Peribacillus asahii]USK84740.1 sensor histidine kinase [Peribacillus asahii]
MKKNWYHIFPKNTGLSPYVWIIFCILPFYFIFKSSSKLEIAAGIGMILLFFVAYGLSFAAKGWSVYLWTSIQIIISIAMTSLFGYIYFALFLAFFIGNIQNKIGFYTLYTIHIITTILGVNVGFLYQNKIFLTQFPFIVICVIGVVLIPFNTYNRKKREQLEEQLEDANKRISELVKIEERQRIARDLHDTLGQKLSLIGLKSDLAGKLLTRNPETAKNEIKDIQQTARTALKEVRDLVSEMRGTRLVEEMLRIRQILNAAQIELELVGSSQLKDTPLLVENVLSMCLKEAVNNIVKHSHASSCKLVIKQLPTEWYIEIEDNGVGFQHKGDFFKGNGLQGMKERLEFVNGSLDIPASNGTKLVIRVPNVIKQAERGKSI